MGSEIPVPQVNNWLNTNLPFIGDYTKRSVRGWLIVFLAFLVLGDLNQDRLTEHMIPKGPSILTGLSWAAFGIGISNTFIAIILYSLGGPDKK